MFCSNDALRTSAHGSQCSGKHYMRAWILTIRMTRLLRLSIGDDYPQSHSTRESEEPLAQLGSHDTKQTKHIHTTVFVYQDLTRLTS